MSTLDQHATFFLYNVPEIAVLLPSRNYYQFIATFPSAIGDEGVALLAQGGARYVIVTAANYVANAQVFSQYRRIGKVSKYDFLERIAPKN